MKLVVPQNFPLKTNFAGLRGNTLSMQNAGWEIAVEQRREESHDGIRISVAGRHRGLNLFLLSGYYVLHLDSIRRDADFFKHLDMLELPISCVAHKVEVVLYGTPEFKAVNFMDFGMQELDINNVSRFNLEQLCLFKTFGKETELFIPEKKIVDVQEYLKDILITQESKQKEIRQRMLRDIERGENAFKNEMENAPKLRLVGY